LWGFRRRSSGFRADRDEHSGPEDFAESDEGIAKRLDPPKIMAQLAMLSRSKVTTAFFVAAFLMFISASETIRQRAQTELEKVDGVGDSPAVAQPIAQDLSASLTKRDVTKTMRKVGDWQLERARPFFSQDWTFAAMYAGFMAVPETVAGDRYDAAMKQMAEKFRWQLGRRPFHADDQAVGQTYLDLYSKYQDKQMILPVRQRMDAMLHSPDPVDQPLWWWCDALFMAPPVLAKLSRTTGDRKYLDFMDRQWGITSVKLYDTKEHLFFRDATFLDKHEANGKPLFWSRGNGWVMAGLVRVLQEMPADYTSRPKYIAQFREMAAALAAVQGKDGLWRPGLLDADAYALPEVSGSAFITYAFAYGVNEGILDGSDYLPRTRRAWAGLLSHIYADGRLGSMQPIGAAPAEFTPTSSYVFGVGAFLLAGSEVYRLAPH
jgi:rhamnogalacturonyl hydrolase YesR